jgi:hypothetical protein
MSAFSRRHASEVCIYLSPKRGRGECRMPNAPAASCALVVVESTRVTTSTPESPGIPARNGFNGFLRALPGDRAFLPPSSTDCSANLTPASGCQDHTTSPYASASFVRALLRAPAAAASTASRSYVRDDRETPLCVGRDGGSSKDDLGRLRSEIFFAEGLDRLMGDLPVGQNHVRGATESRLAKLIATLETTTKAAAAAKGELANAQAMLNDDRAEVGRLGLEKQNAALAYLRTRVDQVTLLYKRILNALCRAHDQPVGIS